MTNLLLILILLVGNLLYSQSHITHSGGMGYIFSLSNTDGEYLNPQKRTAFNIYYYNSSFPIGVYFDSGGSGETFYSDCSNCYDNLSVKYVEETFGDERQEENWSFTKTTIGGLYKIPKTNFIVYTGMGFGTKFYGYRYYDPYHILENNGRYWIPADKEESFNSLSYGIMFVYDIYGLQIGYETFPESLMFGFLFNFPDYP